MLSKKGSGLKEVKGDGALTLIAGNVRFKGNLNGQGSLRVDGDFEGEINMEGDVVIGEGGKVNATVKANNLTVAGSLKGKAQVQGRLQISAKGRVEGDVQAGRLAVEEGGVLLGQCSAYPGREEPPAKPAKAGIA
ncbi:MAG: polymer-forming cytoskeletal protein [Bacillota bacterium]